jgi:tetratricopeptide (TPR) repeat protein
LFLYCVTLEASPDPAFRYQIPEAYKALHKLCRSRRPPLMASDQTHDHKVWMEDPFLWYNFGIYFLQDNEVLLARDAFALFMKAIPPDDESLTVEILMNLAKNCANFQNYEDAVTYGDLALEKDRYNKETRRLLSAWSEVRKAELALQDGSATAILKVWRQRCWQPGYRKRYTKLVVNELEQSIAKPSTKYDLSVRHELAYFARDKWRARFLFEEECAARIQRSYRGARFILSIQRAGREKYKQLANAIYAAALKRPFDPSIREELRRIAGHRFCPKNHNVIGFAGAMVEQEKAHAVIRKAVNTFRLKKHLADRHEALVYRGQVHAVMASIQIQKLVRMKLAVRRTVAIKKASRRRHTAATIIQKYIRKRNSSFSHSVRRLLLKEKIKKECATNLIVMAMVARINRKRKQRVQARKEKWAAISIQRMFQRRLVLSINSTYILSILGLLLMYYYFIIFRSLTGKKGSRKSGR